jgi:hypothetical protein
VRPAVLALALAIAWPAAASGEEAASGDQARARQLFEQGVAAARAEDLGAAIDAFVESYALYPHPGTLLNLGLYQIRAGRRVDAHATLSALMERWGEVISDLARDEVGQRLRELEAALAFVTISTSPPGAAVSLDGVELGRTPLAAPIPREPGPCTVEARLEGHEPATETLDLRAGERSTVSLVLAPIADPDEPPALVVESRTAGALASVDEAEPAPVPLRLALEPGEHEVALSAPGHASQTRQVTLPESGEVRLDITLVPLPAPPPPPPRRRWPWIVGAVAAAAVAATAVALGVTLSEPEPEEDWMVRIR